MLVREFVTNTDFGRMIKLNKFPIWNKEKITEVTKLQKSPDEVNKFFATEKSTVAGTASFRIKILPWK